MLTFSIVFLASNKLIVVSCVLATSTAEESWTQPVRTIQAKIELMSNQCGATGAALVQAVTDAKGAIDTMTTVSPLLGKTADDTTHILGGIRKVNSFQDTWSALLDRVELFSKVVEEITEVRKLS